MRKKFLKGVVSFSVATAICLAFGAVTASAADTLDEGKIKVDYENQKVVVTLNETVKKHPEEASEENLGKLIDEIKTDVLSADAAVGATVNFTVNGEAVEFGTSKEYVLSDGSVLTGVTISLSGTNANCFVSDGNGLLQRSGNTISYANPGSAIDNNDLPAIKITAETADISLSSPKTISLKVATVEAPDNTDHQILFNVASVNKSKVLKPSAWEVYDIEGDEVAIDITSLNTQKDNYVQIKGDVSKDPITLMIPATDKAKLKFDAYEGRAYFDKGADASKTADYEYRTEYSDWSEAAKLEDIDLKMYQERGAKLYFRLSNTEASQKVSEISAVAANKITGVKEKGATEDLLVYKAASLPGKEIKVSVGKKANAPKATVNYTKGIVTIPSGALYRVNDENGVTKFSTAATTSKLELSSASTAETDKANFAKLIAGGSLEVKKAGDPGKKKAESKIFKLEFPNAKESLTLDGDDTENVKDNSIEDPTDRTKKVTATVEEVKKGQKTTFKLTIKNGTAYNYEVVVGDKPAANAKGKAVKAGKDVPFSNLESGKAVWVRRSADQKKAEWATEYIQMGVIPAASTEGPSAEEIAAIKADLQKVADEYIATGTTDSHLMVSRRLFSGAGTGEDAITLEKIVQDGKTVTWGQPFDYEVGTATPKEKIEGVTIFVAITSQKDASDGDVNHFIVADDKTVKAVSQPTSGDVLVVKVTLTKDNQSIDKDVVIEIDNSNVSS